MPEEYIYIYIYIVSIIIIIRFLRYVLVIYQYYISSIVALLFWSISFPFPIAMHFGGCHGVFF